MEVGKLSQKHWPLCLLSFEGNGVIFERRKGEDYGGWREAYKREKLKCWLTHHLLRVGDG